ncbi:MAG TPA: gamma-glutamylcyclotransferase family protein [Candidatus Limnocylindria bacterium]|nr:gamma-glutamylcyclotransferase family protein [Candidatus Limnocylindria bacterium]
MLYFAYASNLNPAQMRERAPGHHMVGLAVLHDHRLVFPRYSDHWGGGMASVTHAHGQTVWGMIHEVGDEDLATLDRLEGFQGPGNQHNLYDRELITVELVRPDDGSVPRRVRAAAYLARPSNPSPPSRRYLDTILAGARHHRLPEEYVEALQGHETASEAT